MIKLIVGTKGTGKTKTLIEMAKKLLKNPKGNVVCVEKGEKLVRELPNTVRPVNSEEYDIQGFACLYGFWQDFWQATMTSPTCLSTVPSKSARLVM